MLPRADPKNQLFAQTRRGQEVLTKVKQFMRQHVFPAEKVGYERVSESPSSWWADSPPFSTALRAELYRHLELTYARGCAHTSMGVKRGQREQAVRTWRYEVGPYIWGCFLLRWWPSTFVILHLDALRVWELKSPQINMNMIFGLSFQTTTVLPFLSP